MTPPANTSSTNLPKQLNSPSKGSSGRTYDSSLVSKEMRRIGSLTYLRSAATGSTPAPTPPSNTSTTSIASTDNPWGTLHVHILPLFNGEPLRIPVEDLNTLVKRHIQSIVGAAPLKALSTLENDASDLISSGMVTLNAKLAGIEDDKLVSRVVEIWGFFWDQILPYVEGVLLPLHTDPVLTSLYRVPKAHRPSNASGRSIERSLSSHTALAVPHIDVRTIAIRAFRDQIILPIFSRLYGCLTMPTTQDSFLMEKSSYQQPRLQQMLLVLVSQGRQRAVLMSLTAPAPQPSAGEAAIQHLLRAIRSPLTEKPSNSFPTITKTGHSFFSGGKPRDRRGRIGNKLRVVPDALLFDEETIDGAETPTVRNPSHSRSELGDMEREIDREFLDALKSPDIYSDHGGSPGGWGLGDWRDDVNAGKYSTIEDDDEYWD